MEKNIVRKKKLPIGIERFEKIRTEGFYYVDKTGFIRELLDDVFKVDLITRPRRFGKTLMVSMTCLWQRPATMGIMTICWM